MKTSVRIVSVQAEIRNGHLPNISLNHCPSSQLARMGAGCCGTLACTGSVNLETERDLFRFPFVIEAGAPASLLSSLFLQHIT
jgi:hypothetical protein